MWKISGTVLVVEADPLLRALLKDYFSASGAVVVSAATCHEAIAALTDGSASIDIAILDISRKIENVFDVADLVRAREIPFAFTVPLLSHPIPIIHQSRPAIAKPYRIRELLYQLLRARAGFFKQ